MDFLGPSGAPSTDMIEHVYACVKNGKVYQLTGKGALGRFKAPVSFADGDSFTVNGAAAAAYMGADPIDELAKDRWYRFVLDTESGNPVLNFKSGRVKVTYVVKHNKQNVSGSGYTLDAAQDFMGVKGKKVTPEVKSYTGFTAPAKQTVKLARNTVVDYNYARNKYNWVANHYTMNLDGSNYSYNSQTTGTAYYESIVTPDTKSFTGFTAPAKSSLTIGTGNNTKAYYYSRNKYTVTCIDRCGGTELGRNSWSAFYGSTAYGSSKGSSTATDAYYTNYGYTGSTSASVGTNGATVYRNFEWRIVNVGSLNSSVIGDDSPGIWKYGDVNYTSAFAVKNGTKISFTGKAWLALEETKEYSQTAKVTIALINADTGAALQSWEMSTSGNFVNTSYEKRQGFSYTCTYGFNAKLSLQVNAFRENTADSAHGTSYGSVTGIQVKQP